MARLGLKRSEEETAGGSRAALRVVTPGRGMEPGVRSICPFCGNSEQTTSDPCCEEWWKTTSGDNAASGRRWLSRAEGLRSASGIERRLSTASQFLLTLLAFSIVALCISVAAQRRPAEEPLGDDVLIARAKAPRAALAEVASPPLHPEAADSGVARPPQAAAPAAVVSPPSTVDSAPPVTKQAPPRPAAVVQAAARAPKALPPSSALTSAPSTTVPAEPGHVARVRRPQISPAPRLEAKPRPAEDATDRPPGQPGEPEASQPVVVEALRPDAEVARRVEEADAEMRGVRPPPSDAHPARLESRWSQLRRGMSQEAVLALLGQPRWKRLLITTEWWLYKDNTLYGTGWVAISVEEGVISWREP